MENEKNSIHSGEHLTDENIVTDKDKESDSPSPGSSNDAGEATTATEVRAARVRRRAARPMRAEAVSAAPEESAAENADNNVSENNSDSPAGTDAESTVAAASDDEIKAESSDESEDESENEGESEDEYEDDEEDGDVDDGSDDDTVNIPVLFYEITEALATAVCMVVLVFTLVVRAAVVSGYSMEHTLSEADVLVVSTIPFEPRYGDIIVFQKFDSYPDHEVVVKRVIATEGQTVDIDFDTWTVTVDGKVIDESGYLYIAEDGYNRDKKMQFPVTVGKGELFVMGDNRKHSTDSREVGLIDERTVFGRVIMRISPISQFKIFGRF